MSKNILVATALTLSTTSVTPPAHALSEGEKNVAGALAILGVAAILHGKHHYREGYEPTNETETADFEAGYRDGLHNYAIDTSYGARSCNEGQSYNEGCSAGQHERQASHSHQRHRAEGQNAQVPGPAVNACLDNTSVRWSVPWQNLHVTWAKQAAAQDYHVEVTAGRHTGVCESHRTVRSMSSGLATCDQAVHRTHNRLQEILRRGLLVRAASQGLQKTPLRHGIDCERRHRSRALARPADSPWTSRSKAYSPGR